MDYSNSTPANWAGSFGDGDFYQWNISSSFDVLPSASHEEWNYNENNYSSDSSVSHIINNPIQMIIKNLDPSIELEYMKNILKSKFINYSINNFNIILYEKSTGENEAAVIVSSLQEAQCIITNLHERFIGNEKISIYYDTTKKLHYKQLKSLVESLLNNAPGYRYRFPLNELIERVEKCSLTFITEIDLSKMKDVCYIYNTVHEGPIVSLILPKIMQTEISRYYEIRNKISWMHKNWSAEQEIVPLLKVTMSLQLLKECIELSLKTHNGSIPLESITHCFKKAQFQQLINIDDNGVPLEHLISCLSSVKLFQKTKNFKYIVWADDPTVECDNNNPVTAVESNHNLPLIRYELNYVLEQQPRCQLKLNDLIPECCKYFGSKCIVAGYSLINLITLIDELKETVQVMGNGNDRVVTLTHQKQVERFIIHLERVLKSQASNQITASDFASAYEDEFGRPFNIADYGVCQISDIFSQVPQTHVVTINMENNDLLFIIPRNQ